MADDALSVYRVAVVVEADVPGVDSHDATNRLEAAARQHLRNVPTPGPGGQGAPPIRLASVMDVGAAFVNSRLAVLPTERLRQLLSGDDG